MQVKKIRFSLSLNKYAAFLNVLNIEKIEND